MEEEKKEASVAGSVAKDIFDNMIKPRFLETTTNTITEILYLFADSAVDWISQKILGRSTARRQGIQRTNYARQSVQNSQTVVRPVTRPSDKLDYIAIPRNIKLPSNYSTIREYLDSIVSDLQQEIKITGKTTVGSFYEKVGHKTEYTDFKFGWDNPDDIHYIPNHDGYWFNMPDPKPVKN